MYYFIYITLYKIAVNFTIINIIISVVTNITINIIINITIIVIITIIIINHQLLVSSLNSLSELLNLSEEIFAMGTTSNIMANELSALPWSRNRRKVMVMMMVVVVVMIMMTTTMIVVLLMMMINSIIVDYYYYYYYYYYYLFTLGSSFDKPTSSSKLKYNLHLHSDSQQKGVTCAHRQDVGYRKRRPPQFRVDTRQDPEHLAEASGTYRRHLRGHVICFRCHEV